MVVRMVLQSCIVSFLQLMVDLDSPGGAQGQVEPWAVYEPQVWIFILSKKSRKYLFQKVGNSPIYIAPSQYEVTPLFIFCCNFRIVGRSFIAIRWIVAVSQLMLMLMLMLSSPDIPLPKINIRLRIRDRTNSLATQPETPSMSP